jgi:hypothetical protein
MPHQIDTTTVRSKYLEHYHELQDLFVKYDVCKLNNGQCAFGVPCCRDDCKHLTETGCTIKSLACKLWVCDYTRSTRSKELIDKQIEVFKYYKKHHMPLIIRESFEQLFLTNEVKLYTRLYFRKKQKDFIFWDNVDVTIKTRLYILWMLLTGQFL